MDKVLVRVDWLHPNQGGRQQLPAGEHYIVVGKFPHQTYEQWLENAWSIRLDWLDKEHPGGWYGLAGFAAPNSPESWLVAGGAFEIYEGPTMIGQVSIVSTAKAIENIFKTAA